MTTAMKTGVLALVAALPLGGCATTLHRSEVQRTEQMLETAGFQVRSPETPEELASMHSMPPRVLVTQLENDGDVVYTYADPGDCRCIYLGGPAEYSAYQRLRVDERLAEAKAKPNPGQPWLWW